MEKSKPTTTTIRSSEGKRKAILSMAILAAIAIIASGTEIGAAKQSYAQYPSGGAATGATTPQQIQECKTLNIPPENCNDNTILAARKVGIAAANPSTGSGTSMLTSETGTMVAFIAILGVIFGGVAAAFFLKGRGAKPVSS